MSKKFAFLCLNCVSIFSQNKASKSIKNEKMAFSPCILNLDACFSTNKTPQ